MAVNRRKDIEIVRIESHSKIEILQKCKFWKSRNRKEQHNIFFQGNQGVKKEAVVSSKKEAAIC